MLETSDTNLKPLRAVIVEDEQKARRILQTLLLEHCTGIEVVGMAEDVPNGVKTIISTKPDIVFLDIELPGFNGFELADFFEKIDFEIVFTTAYSEYAIKAFQMSALDYLLKPIQISQLQQTIEKAREKKGILMNEKMAVFKANLGGGFAKKVALPIAEGYLFVDLNEIIYLEADNSYTTVFLVEDKKVLVSKSLKEFVEIISSDEFFKPHRSYYVNANHIRQYNRQDSGSLIMDNGDVIYIARDKKSEFLEFMQNRNF